MSQMITNVSEFIFSVLFLGGITFAVAQVIPKYNCIKKILLPEIRAFLNETQYSLEEARCKSKITLQIVFTVLWSLFCLGFVANTIAMGGQWQGSLLGYGIGIIAGLTKKNEQIWKRNYFKKINRSYHLNLL